MKLSTYICGNELLHIIDTLDSDFTLADHWIVIRVGGDEQGLCKELMCSMLTVFLNKELTEAHNPVDFSPISSGLCPVMSW